MNNVKCIYCNQPIFNLENKNNFHYSCLSDEIFLELNNMAKERKRRNLNNKSYE